VGEVDAKVTTAVNRMFGIGTNEQTQPPVANSGYRLFYELPQDRSMAYIWAVDTNDIRSEGMSYGMMIAVQMDMQEQFDKLWKFARTFMQFPANSNLTSWRYYFRWQGSVNTSNAQNWQVNYGAQTGPAPDGEEYFAAALYLANRRWGSDGGVNYLQDAQNLSSAMLNNPSASGRTAVINAGSNMVVFYPSGGTANYSDPSYHLPAFYELFALDGPQNDSARWRQVANVSRGFFVSSAHPTTGLHPDYANFNGTANTGGSDHDDFRYDAWRVVMNMGIDYSWFSTDARLKTQAEKYHSFFGSRIIEGNVRNQTFSLDGSNAAGAGSTALTATLAAGALASAAGNRADFVDNLWKVQQQSGTYRYYQETVYLLGLLATSGVYGYEWAGVAPQ
jgi:oligosaccharide reducing-end xylanase